VLVQGESRTVGGAGLGEGAEGLHEGSVDEIRWKNGDRGGNGTAAGMFVKRPSPVETNHEESAPGVMDG
jgi:hypothetical protein